MQFWKSLAIGLMVLLFLSYVGFAYVYSQGGGIMIAGMVTSGMQPKVVTLLRNSNITLQGWNISVEILGYKTGFLYCQLADMYPTGFLYPNYRFEVDEILTRSHELGQLSTYSRSRYWEISLEGTKMWVWFERIGTAPAKAPQSAVISMSLYLRD